MTNQVPSPNDQTLGSARPLALGHLALVIWSLIRHSSFVIHQASRAATPYNQLLGSSHPLHLVISHSSFSKLRVHPLQKLHIRVWILIAPPGTGGIANPDVKIIVSVKRDAAERQKPGWLSSQKSAGAFGRDVAEKAIAIFFAL